MTYKQIISDSKLILIAGPCVVEGEKMVFEIAETVKRICLMYDITFIFKASYKKANRSNVDSFTGIGDEQALNIIHSVGKELDVLTITDVHTEEEAENAAKYADILQIPAFLCRQTSLLEAASKTGKMINIKKGQFMSPEAMKFAVEKVKHFGNDKIFLTERGTTFGYQDLVVDFTSFPIMNKFAPTIMDCTHSLQKPNQFIGVTGGRPEYIGTMAKAAVAVGAKGLFIETHSNPKEALSDGANMLHLSKLDELLKQVSKIHEIVKEKA